jgi:hypothetical protein
VDKDLFEKGSKDWMDGMERARHDADQGHLHESSRRSRISNSFRVECLHYRAVASSLALWSAVLMRRISCDLLPCFRQPVCPSPIKQWNNWVASLRLERRQESRYSLRPTWIHRLYRLQLAMGWSESQLARNLRWTLS